MGLGDVGTGPNWNSRTEQNRRFEFDGDLTQQLCLWTRLLAECTDCTALRVTLALSCVRGRVVVACTGLAGVQPYSIRYDYRYEIVGRMRVHTPYIYYKAKGARGKGHGIAAYPTGDRYYLHTAHMR